MIFGDKIAGLDYRYRKGVYAVIFNAAKDKIAIIRGSRGKYFLAGGGVENNENDAECLERELLEETGYEIEIGTFIGRAQRYFHSTRNEPILSDGYFFLAKLKSKVQEPIEEDHFLEWVTAETVPNLLESDNQVWAVKEAIHSTYDPSIKKLLAYATSENKLAKQYELYNQSQNRKLYGFKQNNSAIGCIGIEFPSPNQCEIKHIVVSPDFRGYGLGRKMIQFVIDQNYLTGITAETDKDAVGFYQKCGFQVTSLGEKYPGVERYCCTYSMKEAAKN
ncbi:GNAT family N-acetyltransferase [Virgibacillus flavescens]|uniref:GNAT family N-acetyltransferase n=1 Tax=Virgibacillus flavescens TaxID=1611422 RepID=UPI003D346EC4